MSEITPEKTHALLEKLAEYVMNEIPQIKERVGLLETRFIHVETKLNQLIDGMDAQAKRLDTISIDMRAVSGTLDGHENRLGHLEEKVLGYRIRDDKEDYKK